ncbi:hypothetical protein [Maribacter sp. 2307ULW6-5]|uniref:hypothetical protein n=1 Tax=Maribacter sp. 2307ULW6-5 TaxID=3386275 RepID=UPI0039BD8E18
MGVVPLCFGQRQPVCTKGNGPGNALFAAVFLAAGLFEKTIWLDGKKGRFFDLKSDKNKHISLCKNRVKKGKKRGERPFFRSGFSA